MKKFVFYIIVSIYFFNISSKANELNPSQSDIKEIFNMSKGSFKRAIGHLYKNKIITIDSGKIALTKKGWERIVCK